MGRSGRFERLWRLPGLSDVNKAAVLDLAEQDETVANLLDAGCTDSVLEQQLLRLLETRVATAAKRFWRLTGLNNVDKAAVWDFVEQKQDVMANLLDVDCPEDVIEQRLIRVLQTRAAARRNPATAAVREVAAIADSVPAFTFAGNDPTTQELRDYLHDFTPLKGLIPIVTCVPDVEDATAAAAFFTGSTSNLGVLVSLIIYFPPLKGSGEALVNTRAVEYTKILAFLMDNVKQESRVAFTISMDNTESQTPRFRTRKRPDFLYEFRHLTLLYAEGKKDEKLAFVIAEFFMQLFVKRPDDEDPETLSKQFDLNQFPDRVTLCLMFFKLYFVMLGMAKRMTRTSR